jgi:hypothetical protein
VLESSGEGTAQETDAGTKAVCPECTSTEGKSAIMATKPRGNHGKSIAAERAFVPLRATMEERERLRTVAPPPRSVEEWLGPPGEVLKEDLAELDWFLQEREALRCGDVQRQEEWLKDAER